MRTIIAIAFALCIVSISAVSSASFRESRDNEIANQLNELRSDAFGQKLLNTIAIELQTSDKVGNVVQVVQDLQTALKNQQEDEDASYTKLKTSYTTIINTQTDSIAVSTQAISNLQQDLSNENKNLATLTSDRQQLITERDSLESFLVTLGARREAEAAAYVIRDKDQNDIVTGLEAVISILEKEANEQDNQTYNKDSLVNVVKKLEELSEAVSASIQSDAAAEVAAAANYQAFVDRSNSRLAEIKQAVEDLDKQIATSQAKIVALTNQIADEEKKIEEYTKIRAQYQGLLDTLEASYAANKTIRENQIRLCQQVITILQTKLEKVKSFLGDSKVEGL